MAKPKIDNPFPKKYTDRQWARYVKQGREMIEEESSIHFRLGDLSLKMVENRGQGGVGHGVFQILDRFADEIGINVNTLLGYRHVASAWPSDKRVPGVSWSIHHALDALPDRFEVIHHPPEGKDRWTEDSALSRAGRLPHRPLTKAEKLDRVRTLMREDMNATEAVEEMIRRPDVAHKVMSNPANQRILYRAHHEQRQEAAAARFADAHEDAAETDATDTYQWPEQNADQEPEQAEETRQVRRREPAVDYQRASSEALELIGSGTTFLVDLQQMIPRLHVSELTEREVRAVLDNHRRIRAALDWCDSALSTGDKSMDEELARILAEGDDES